MNLINLLRSLIDPSNYYIIKEILFLFFFIIGVFDPHKYTNADMCKIHAITYEALMEDEESQVRGFVHFADGAGVSFPNLTLFTPKEAVRIVKNGEVRSLCFNYCVLHYIININHVLILII